MRNRRQNPSIFLTSLIAVSIMTMLSAMPTGAYGDIFVTNNGGNTVGDYTTSGATVNASLITGLNGPTGIALSGSNLFVVNFNGNTVGEYTTSGATVNASLISGLNVPEGIAVSGSNLFVANTGTSTVGEYTTSGTTVNASLITGLISPIGIAVTPTSVSVPEPSTFVIMGLGFAVMFVALRRRMNA